MRSEPNDAVIALLLHSYLSIIWHVPFRGLPFTYYGDQRCSLGLWRYGSI